MSTATTHSTDPRFGAVPVLVVGLYLSTIAIPRILGPDAARLKLVVEALLFGIVLVGFSLLILSRGRLHIDSSYSWLFALVTAFVLLSEIALVVGFAHGYPTGYVLGDFYKFAAPFLTVCLVYGASRSSEQIEIAFAWVFRIALLLFAALLMLYFGGVLPPNTRPGFVYQFPLVLLLGYWLYRCEDSVAQYGFPLLAVATLPVIGYSQSLSLLLQTVLIGAFAFVYVSSDELEDLGAVGAPIAVLGLLVAGVVVLLGSLVPASQWEQYGYLGSKMVAIAGDYSFFERLIILGGSRAAEPIGILARIDDSVFELLFGSGMGSTFVAPSPFPSSTWTVEDHFVHAGLWEAVLRTGLLGGAIYLGLYLSYLYVGWKVSSDSWLGALAAADASVGLVFAPVSGKLLGPQFFSYVLFAYALVRWVELRRD